LELILFSLGGVCAKMAAGHPGLSVPFLFWYSLVIFNLGIYAIVWQQIIKYLPSKTAYANKAITIVWGLFWGVFLFTEAITWQMIVGAIVVIIGVVLVVSADE
jgi:drug/metabolite transporter (DMT)-like permease